MTFTAKETSYYDGQPRELYTFFIGGKVVNYTSSDEAITLYEEGLFVTYQPAFLSRTDDESAAEVDRPNIQIRTTFDFEVFHDFLALPPGDVIAMYIKRIHTTDTDNEIVPVWSGRILSTSQDMHNAILVCEDTYTSTKRMGLRKNYQRPCPYVLYDEYSCRLNKEDWALPITISDITGKVATVPEMASYGNNEYVWGFLEWSNRDYFERRTIKEHQGASVTLNYPANDPSSLVSEAGYGLSYGRYYGGFHMAAYPGCKHTTDNCASFNNIANFGGMPFMPTIDLFKGVGVY